jgi:hypothetical protein
MKKSRYTEEQIIGILKQHEAGVKTADVRSNATGRNLPAALGLPRIGRTKS